MRARIWASDSDRTPTAARESKGQIRQGWPIRLTALSAAALTAAAVAGCASSTAGTSSSSSTGGSSSGGSSSGGSASGSTYTVHAIVGETGSASFLGTEEAAALNALAKHVNATGGIDGHQLAFAISDNQSAASTSVSLASPLLGQSPVLLVGSITSTDKPVDDLVTSTGPVIYDLSPGDHPKPGSFVYSSSNSTTNQTQAFINFCESKGWKKVGVITSTDSSGQDGWTNIQKAVASSNGAVTISDHESFDPSAVSVTTELSKIKATNPQAVMVWTTGTPLGTVLSGMQQLGLDNVPTMTTNGNASDAEMQRLANELPAQLYFPGAPFMAGVQNLTGQTKTEVQAFDDAMAAAGQKVPDEGDALSWDPGLILVSALKKFGIGATASQIHQYIDSLTDFAGINGTYNFTDPSIPDNRGLTINSVYIAQWNKSQSQWTAASGPAGKGSA
jgi:branched-chain amino acid transport system substrate-binding protein